MIDNLQEKEPYDKNNKNKKNSRKNKDDSFALSVMSFIRKRHTAKFTLSVFKKVGILSLARETS